MRISRMRSSLRGLMVAVALGALGFSAATATSRALPGRFTTGCQYSGRATFLAGGGYLLDLRGIPHGFGGVAPPRPSALWVYSPALAAASITLMVLFIVWRPRPFTAFWRVTLALATIIAIGSLQAWWMLYGGQMPPLERLRLGMTRREAQVLVGPPNQQGSTHNSWLISRPGSLYWARLEFDESSRLVAYSRCSHLRAGSY